MKTFFISSIYILSSLLASSINGESLPAASCLDLKDIADNLKNLCEKNDKNFVIMEFFSPKCSHCQTNAKEFKKLEEEIKDFAHTRLISFGGLPQTLSFLNTHGISTETVLDSNHEALNAYSITHVPTLVILDESNFIIHRYTGVLNPEEINLIKILVSGSSSIAPAPALK